MPGETSDPISELGQRLDATGKAIDDTAADIRVNGPRPFLRRSLDAFYDDPAPVIILGGLLYAGLKLLFGRRANTPSEPDNVVDATPPDPTQPRRTP